MNTFKDKIKDEAKDEGYGLPKRISFKEIAMDSI
jgi:hypothetical protein